MESIEQRAAAMVKRPLYTTRKQSSGYASSVSYLVWKLARDGKSGGRVSVHAHRHRDAAQVAADELNIAALVLPHAEDPRPYDVRRVEAELAYQYAKAQAAR